MTDNILSPSATDITNEHQADLSLREVIPKPLFEAVDWRSFVLTFGMAFIVYLDTLAPSVTLDNGGVYTTGAMYLGVPNPPGYPVWTIFAWLFTVLVPFSNVALRVSVSSAFAAALSCGLIALMVSRGGYAMILSSREHHKIEPKTANWLRLICGYVAGMAFALDTCLWSAAVRPSPWPLTILLFAMVVALLMRWKYSPAQTRYLYAAIFVYGLGLTNSQSLAPAFLGLVLFVALEKPALGRDISGLMTIVFTLLLLSWKVGFGFFENFFQYTPMEVWGMIYLEMDLCTAIIFILTVIKTRKFFTEWKSLLACGFFLGLGLAAFFYLPIASMTNPPLNWGYPRTIDGFWHVVSQGQYERALPSATLSFEFIEIYLRILTKNFGCQYLLLGGIPFVFLSRNKQPEKKWLLNLLGLFICMSAFMLMVIQPAADYNSEELSKIFFAASHLIVAILAGYGLILLAVRIFQTKTPFPV